MEDRALRYSNPRIYAEISRKLSDTKDAREKYIAGFIAPIVDELNKKASGSNPNTGQNHRLHPEQDAQKPGGI